MFQLLIFDMLVILNVNLAYLNIFCFSNIHVECYCYMSLTLIHMLVVLNVNLASSVYSVDQTFM